jgi:simple sugar transport system ATP-binding protein
MNGAPTTRELDDTRTREPASERLSLSGITKAFPGVIANQDISLVIRPGEVHAILGENGAGKSTLVKILYGFYQPDSGSIRADGREVKVHSPADAKRLGIGMVFQQFMLAHSRMYRLCSPARKSRHASAICRNATASSSIRILRSAACQSASSRK